jgi:hypothetical protein
MTAVVALPEAEGAEEDERIQRSKGGHLAAGARHRVSVLRWDQGVPKPSNRMWVWTPARQRSANASATSTPIGPSS